MRYLEIRYLQWKVIILIHTATKRSIVENTITISWNLKPISDIPKAHFIVIWRKYFILTNTSNIISIAYGFVFDLLQFPFAFSFICVNGMKVKLNAKLSIVMLQNSNPLIVYTQTATNNTLQFYILQRICMAVLLWAKGASSCIITAKYYFIHFEIFHTYCRQLTRIISCIYHNNKINFAAKQFIVYCSMAGICLILWMG